MTPWIRSLAVLPAGRIASTKARTFTKFVAAVMHGAAGTTESAWHQRIGARRGMQAHVMFKRTETSLPLSSTGGPRRRRSRPALRMPGELLDQKIPEDLDPFGPRSRGRR